MKQSPTDVDKEATEVQQYLRRIAEKLKELEEIPKINFSTVQDVVQRYELKISELQSKLEKSDQEALANQDELWDGIEELIGRDIPEWMKSKFIIKRRT